MTNITYRNATQADLPKIVEIYNSTIASKMVTADTEPITVKSREQWFREHNTTTRPLWIIENQVNETIGWISFQSFYGRTAYDATVEVSIYLEEKQRKKGLGKHILQSCLDKAPNYGIKTVLGFIFSHNEPSLKLFRSLGFEEWANLPNVALIDGKEYGLKIMGKRIC